MYHGKRKFLTASILLALIGGATFWATPSFVGAENGSPPHVHQTGMTHQESSGWQEQLKGQTRVEDALEGRAGLSEKIEVQHHRIMRRLEEQAQQDAQAQANSGVFNNVSMMHQYMGQDGSSYLLAVDPQVDLSAGNGAKCPAGVPSKHYDISMIDAEITLNRWLDYYVGYMYVLTENIDKVRAEEAQNKAARDLDGFDPGAVTTGLQGDYIQPLAIRANQGDCLKITLRNQMEIESGSFHVNGGGMVMSATGKAASTSNPDTVVEVGQSTEMEWYIHPQTQEGVRRFHSYSNARELTVMGLFGALIVEPAGSKYLDPLGTGQATELKSGWQAIVDNGSGHDFREFVIFYHEVGDEAFRPVNKKGDFLPQRDPLTDAYRPGGRALNYRSEPFGIDEMHVQHEYFGFEDESLAYSAYTFGDAPTTIPRAYLGDPVKCRLVHGGSEVFHSHHPHSGSIRWQRSPRADQQEHWYLGKDGPVKYPVIRTKIGPCGCGSDRAVRGIGP